MADIKPIETFYNGYRFRSRLEARWAVFFNALKVKFEYEPEGYKLPSGLCYLPDFKVTCCGKRGSWCRPFDLFIEVKGKMAETDADKIIEFASFYDKEDDYGCKHPVLIVGNIPECGCCHNSWDVGAYTPMNGIEIYPFNYDLIDGDYFAAYPAADACGNFYLWGDDSNYINNCDVARVEAAYTLARTARFEYGETPAI